MTRFIYTILVGLSALFMAISCGNGGQSSNSDTASDTPQSLMTVEILSTTTPPLADTIHLGRMRSGEVLQSAFTLCNKTTNPLVITQIRVACGCAKASYSTKPILPSESREVRFTFDSKGMSGTQYKFFDVEFANAGNSLSNLKVHFTAEITN